MQTSTRTLAIDIGGTGIKAILLDADGKALTERVRVATPRPATPGAVLAALAALVSPLGKFDRISTGFPGVVVDGITLSAHNLDPAWLNFRLAKELSNLLHKPARVLNDAGVQGFGVISGKGTEMVLTLGTGFGCALYVEYVGNAALEKIGKKAWNKRVARVIAQVLPIFNPSKLYLGGGNAEKLTIELPKNVSKVSNVAGLLGGIALWRE
jgi:polyphosphate glucokinase